MKKLTDWDAETYDKVTENLEQWGTTIMKNRNWSGNETVLDAGCGSGKLTKTISLVTKGKIYAVDKDPDMVRKAKENLFGIKNVTVIQSDLLTLDDEIKNIKMDVIFSNAVLHWIQDHYTVFLNFRSMLNNMSETGGELLIQCGGYGNLSNAISIFEQVKNHPNFKNYFSKWKNPWNFAKPNDTESLLKKLGYRNIKTGLFHIPVIFKDKDSYLTYIKTVILDPYLKQLPSDELKHGFLVEITRLIENKYPEMMWNLDYVRLNIVASN